MSRLNLYTAPASEPVSTDELKSHLRVDITDDDAYIATLEQTVRVTLERQYDTAFISQTWDWYLDDFPATEFSLPLWPAVSVTSIKYTNSAGVETTYDSSNYLVDIYSKPARVTLKTASSWPSVTLKESNAVVIRFVAGYGATAANVPAPVKQAIKILVGELYENREELLIAQGVTVARLDIAKDLMRNYRSWNV